jgi:hypothetical protein
MLAVQRRYKALAVFSFGAVIVAAVSLLMTPLHDYITAVTQAQEQTIGFFPVGLRGATSALGLASWYPILVAATVVICLWLMRHLPAAEALSVAITGTLMTSPYVCWYDSTLLALVIVVLWARSGKPLRIACVLVLIAVPLWFIGGGFMHRPGGYMHIGVEVAILAYYVNAVWVSHPGRGARTPACSVPIPGDALLGSPTFSRTPTTPPVTPQCIRQSS